MADSSGGVVISHTALAFFTWLATLGVAVYCGQKFDSVWAFLFVLVLGLIATGKVKAKDIFELLQRCEGISFRDLTKGSQETDKRLEGGKAAVEAETQRVAVEVEQ